MGYLISSCWPMGVSLNIFAQTLQAITIALGYPPEFKTLLLKKSHTYITEHGEANLEGLFLLVFFLVLEFSMQANGIEKQSTVLPSY